MCYPHFFSSLPSLWFPSLPPPSFQLYTPDRTLTFLLLPLLNFLSPSLPPPSLSLSHLHTPPQQGTPSLCTGTPPQTGLEPTAPQCPAPGGCVQDQEEEECLERMRERQRRNNEQQYLSLVPSQCVLPSLVNKVKFLGPTCIPKCRKDNWDCNHHLEVHLKQ